MNISQFIITIVSILVGAYLLPGVDASILGAVILAIVLGVISLFIKPIITILTLPLTILTFGLFALVINALIIMLGARIVEGFTVDGFWWALGFSIVLSLLQAFFGVGLRSSKRA
jgi:putative membrane protein